MGWLFATVLRLTFVAVVVYSLPWCWGCITSAFRDLMTGPMVLQALRDVAVCCLNGLAAVVAALLAIGCVVRSVVDGYSSIT